MWRSKAVDARIDRQRSTAERIKSDFDQFCEDQELRLRDELFGSQEHDPLVRMKRTAHIDVRGHNVGGAGRPRFRG